MAFDSQKIEQFFRLQTSARYDVIVQHCKQKGSLWTLQDEEGCIIVDLGKEKVLPVWHDAELANSWRGNEYKNTTPLQITHQELTEKWIPGMSKDGFHLGIAPNLAGDSIVVNPAEFANDIGATIIEAPKES